MTLSYSLLLLCKFKELKSLFAPYFAIWIGLGMYVDMCCPDNFRSPPVAWGWLPVFNIINCVCNVFYFDTVFLNILKPGHKSLYAFPMLVWCGDNLWHSPQCQIFLVTADDLLCWNIQGMVTQTRICFLKTYEWLRWHWFWFFFIISNMFYSYLSFFFLMPVNDACSCFRISLHYAFVQQTNN